MSYTHLSISQRTKLEAYLETGLPVSQIARLLGVHRSTIYREIQRCGDEKYTSDTAHEHYESKQHTKGRKCLLTRGMKHCIENGIQNHLSPQQIQGFARKNQIPIVAYTTIYRWIDERKVDVTVSQLRQKGKRRRPQSTRGKFNTGRTIDQRPKSVETRRSVGHWELDTVVSAKGTSKACVATFLERKTRFFIAIKIPDRTAASMLKAIRVVMRILPRWMFKTFTVDRGKEFACSTHVEYLFGVPVYFADPYCSYQRGSNENANGLLREFFPKGTNFAMVSQDDINEAVRNINARPRECLNWTPAIIALKDELNYMELLSH